MGARTMGARMAFDESGREMLREIVTAQPHATLDEVTAEFTRRTELTVNAATVRKALRQAGLRQERGAVVVKRRSQEDEAAKQRYGDTDEHRRQEPDQRYPSCLTQTEWELVADLFEQSGKRGRPPQYSRWDLVASSNKCMIGYGNCGAAARNVRRSRLRRCWMPNRPAVLRRAIRAAMTPARRSRAASAPWWSTPWGFS